MSTITILSHQSIALAKTWLTDGTISAYDNAKYFRHRSLPVSSISELSAILSAIESDHLSCVIRGQYVGDLQASTLDPEYKKGFARRIIELFDDVPRPYVMVEVDNFIPIIHDPVSDPERAVGEYISTCLPPEFQGVSHHWQLSNSAGSTKHAGKLKVHIWFWLDTAYTSEQLRQWVKAKGIELDTSVLQQVQIHYTSAPVFEPGVIDPVSVRSGFVDGLVADSVALVITSDIIDLAQKTSPTATKADRLRLLAQSDERAKLLHEKGLVKSLAREGHLNITCPREDKHSGAGGVSSTVYYLPNTGGFSTGHFVCLHAHCKDVSQGAFNSALGYFDITDMFDDETPLTGDTVVDSYDNSLTITPFNALDAMRMMDIPEPLSLCSDLANSKRLRKKFRNEMFHCDGEWYVWSGKHWRVDENGARVRIWQLSHLVNDEVGKYEQLLDIEEVEDRRAALEGVIKSLKAWIVKCESKSVLDAAEKLLAASMKRDKEVLDIHHHLINTQNCTVDIRTKEIMPHDQRHFITVIMPGEYYPEVNTDRVGSLFIDVVEKVMLDDKRPKNKRDLSSFLQRWFGYSATGYITEQKFAVLFGEGSNGKSTVINTITHVMNPYCTTVSTDVLMKTKGDTLSASMLAALANFKGRRMITANESSEGGVLRDDLIKNITGGDKLTARLLYGNFFTWDPTHKIQMLTNHMPQIASTDHGIWRRIMAVPFEAKFGSQADVDKGDATHFKDLTTMDKLQSQKEINGVIKWLIDGAHEWFKNGLQVPDRVRIASEKYRIEQNRMLQFVNECCDIGDTYTTVFGSKEGGIYSEYVKWCTASRIFPIGKPKFMRELKSVVPSVSSENTKLVLEGGSRKDVLLIKGIKLSTEI